MQFTNTLHAMFPAVPTLFLVGLPVAKETLEPGRLVSFFAVAILAARFLPSAARLGRFPAVRAVACCGRHSLPIFCIGILLAVLGHVTLLKGGHSFAVQMVLSLAGIGLQLAIAWMLDWVGKSARAPALAEPVPDAVRLAA
jgi:hypothetical protein